MTTSSKSNLRPGRLAALALLATLGLSACAAPFDASVSRFSRELPAPAGHVGAVLHC